MKGKGASIKIQRLKYVMTDWVTTNIAFFLFNIVRYCILYTSHPTKLQLIDFLTAPKLLWEQLLIPLLGLVVYWLSGYYMRPILKSRLQELITTIISASIMTAGIYLALLTNDQIVHRSSNWGLILVLMLLMWLIVYAGRLTITQMTLKQFEKRDWSFQTLIVGTSEAAEEVAGNLKRQSPSFGYYNVVAFVDIPSEKLNKKRVTGLPVIPVEKAEKMCSEGLIDTIILAPQTPDENRILSLLFRFFALGVPIRLAPVTLSFMTSAIHMQDIYAEPFIDLTSPSVSDSSKIIKRVADICLSAIALLILFPFLGLIALWVKLDSKGPFIYSQTRIGLHHQPFKIYKFRSMVTDAEKDVPLLSSDTDRRITRVGAFLRKYRLDELPQFWNVLRGDMSLVGPRPEREYFIRQIIEKAPYYTLVHQVRPGLTSWGMVKYGYASTLDEMVKRARYDLIYLSNMSIAVDIKILLHTVRTVIGGEGK